MLATRAGAADVLWRHGDEQPAAPRRFVFQLTAQLQRARIQDRAIERRLRWRALPFSRCAHILYLQVFDADDRVVFADAVRSLIDEIFSDVGNLAVQLRDTRFRFLPVLRELSLSR